VTSKPTSGCNGSESEFGILVCYANDDDNPFHRIYTPAATILSIVMPTLLTWWLGEELVAAYHWNIFRYVFGLHITWLVNSGAHFWGTRPYEK